MKRRARLVSPPPPPTVPELVLAPELAAILLLELAINVAQQALLAEHPTLIDDFARARDDAPILALAETICRRAAVLEQSLRHYRRAVRDASSPARDDDAHDDLPF
jgi:hypothetical protein